MLKKYVSLLILKNYTAQWVWTGRAGPEKLGMQTGQAYIFRPGGMGQAERVCDFDGRTGLRD
jgi:hypothetical protein